MKTYSTPALADLGDVRTLTAADQQSTQTDQIFNNGESIGTSQGSLDACVSPSPNPQPGDTCT
ncbi:lasso RiPP family leader peptide-containing protein [Rubrivirga sp. S365]|uniref:Lasso RiPP family leader peptide-containing protein n=1 Tax=Rubrivirga litoralis TaxID=3075598 RepID=A0ABU3BSQ4_9BACT|nr:MULTISPECIES: lasso RiPP family leader peptide-containing protein [unclassified Rubrivirga]MDT0632314.1 lasso RiPP family leader peptide-containing protein [Rubrivirga sp. F394]MDT7856301.1 lasso RiPP family leader peptide-containing protein [Rubrivirga sp. S365]